MECCTQVELNGKKGWSIDGSWNLIEDSVYSRMIHPLKTSKFGNHEFPVPTTDQYFFLVRQVYTHVYTHVCTHVYTHVPA